MNAMKLYEKSISVILPTYKPGYYIFECLASVITQTLEKSFYELIIILNGEKEPYFTELHTYIEEKASCIDVKLLYSANKGVSNARNIGIDNSCGEFICFLDDDDVLSPAYLSGLLECANGHSMPICNIKSFMSDIRKEVPLFFIHDYLKGIKLKTKLYSFFSNRSIFSVPVGKLIHREVIGKQRFHPSIDNGEDALFITSLTSRIPYLIVCNEDAVYYVRLRPGSASRHKIPLMKLLKTTFILIIEYLKMLCDFRGKYRFLFILSRVVAVTKNFYILAKNG